MMPDRTEHAPQMPATQPPKAVIAYLLKRYPRLSETFILHEILELERQGVDLRLFSIMNPNEQVVHAEVARVRAPVQYLPVGWQAVGPLLRAHLTLVTRAPRRYLRVVRYILTRRRHRSTIKHFVRAGWLARELEKVGATRLHAHFAHGPASVAHFVHLLTGLPFSFTAHAKDIYTSPPNLLAVKMRAAQFVVTCTDYNARYLADLIVGEKPIQRIYHGVDLRLFTPSGCSAPDDRPDEARSILAIGRLVEKKGFPTLIEACRLLRAEGYDIRLRIVGDGPMKGALSRQIEESGLAEHVTLLASRSQRELLALYRAAELFVLPCVVAENGDRDGIPNVLVEAMSLGVPVVSTTVSGIPELVIDGRTGLLVPPHDPRALATALARFLDDPPLRARLAAEARRHVTTEFDLATNAARLKALLLGDVADGSLEGTMIVRSGGPGAVQTESPVTAGMVH